MSQGDDSFCGLCLKVVTPGQHICPGLGRNPLFDLPRNANLPPGDKSVEDGKSASGSRASVGKYLALCVPMYRDITYATFDCVDRLRAAPPPAGWEHINFQTGKGHPAALTREGIMEQIIALERENGIRHSILLWVDSDNGFVHPERLWDLVLRLDAAPSKIQVLGVPCPKRGFDPAKGLNVGGYTDKDGELLDVLYNAGTLPLMPDTQVAIPTHYRRMTTRSPYLLVRRIGFGIVAMRRGLFDALERPWFDTKWVPAPPGTPTQDRFIGEDALFCDAVRKAGFLVAADFMLAREAWHLFEDLQRLPDSSTIEWSDDVSWSDTPVSEGA